MELVYKTFTVEFGNETKLTASSHRALENIKRGRSTSMCRWFAYLSNTEPCLLEDVLIAPTHSLAKQVHDHYLPKLTHYEPDNDPRATEKEIALRNRLFNIDGLGVAW